MAFFQDVMDTDRIVKPIDQKGGRTMCEVYYLAGGQYHYHGKTEVPSVLLQDPKERPINRHIGFVPYKNIKV